MTGTVKREAATLVHLETEHEALVTTPEHPFATPGSGWIRAGQLAPGDWVVSAKFGVVRVLSVQSEMPSHSVAVFNLSVDRSHAYLVGADQVLVHNKKCKDPAEISKEIEEAKRELQELEREQTLATTAEDKARLEQRIAAAKSRIAKLKVQAHNARQYQRRRKSPTEDALIRHTRALEAIERQIETLKAELTSARDKTEIQKRLGELEQERKKVSNAIDRDKARDKIRRGEYVPRAQRQLQSAEVEYESAKKELEVTQSALRELEAQTPRTDAKKRMAQTQKAELERRLKGQELDYDQANRILTWEKEIAEIERARSSGGKRPELERKRTESRAKINAERRRTRDREAKRKQRTDPEQKEALLEVARRIRQRSYRSAAYVVDTERPRDRFERMQEELAALLEQPASTSRKQRIDHLTDAIETQKRLVEMRRKENISTVLLASARRKHKELIDQGTDTKEIDQTITRLSQELAARRAERNKLRVQALLLGIAEVPGRKGKNAVDEARFRELERELAEPMTLDDARLTELEREWAETLRGESDTLDAEFFEEIWGEAESDSAAAQDARA